MNNTNSINPEKKGESIFTLLSWVVPIVIVLLSLLLMPILSRDSGDFIGILVIAYIGFGIIVGSFAGLGLGLVALFRREPDWRTALTPVILSTLFLIRFYFS